MKSYTIYLNDKGDPINDAVYLPEGFSLSAAVFNIFWMFYNRLWLQTILFSIISVCILEMRQAYIIDSVVSSIAFAAIWIYIGLNGRDYLRQRLEKDGYKMADIIIAQSDEEAELRFISKQMES